jgi:hypothetical protein
MKVHPASALVRCWFRETSTPRDKLPSVRGFVLGMLNPGSLTKRSVKTTTPTLLSASQ